MFKNQTILSSDIKGNSFFKETFVNCRFDKADLKFSAFVDCTFINCDWSGVLFELTTFEKCRFEECKFNYLDFSEVEFKLSIFDRCLLKNTYFSKQKPGDKNHKTEKKLAKIQIIDCDLSGSIFVKCDLQQASFAGSILDGVVFEKCNLSLADLSVNSMRQINFNDSKTNQTKLTLSGFLDLGLSKGFVLITDSVDH